MTSDLINGLFEGVGSAFLLLNVRAIHRSRSLAGVHWAPTVFWTAWGVWNIYFYPANHLWFSFAGGLAVVAMNLVWLFYLSWITLDDAVGRWLP